MSEIMLTDAETGKLFPWPNDGEFHYAYYADDLSQSRPMLVNFETGEIIYIREGIAEVRARAKLVGWNLPEFPDGD